MVHQVFGQLGLGDRAVADYVTDVLAAFAHTDRLYRLRTVEGRRIESVVEMLGGSELASRRPAEWERDLRKYIGDYTLFTSGMFRAYVSRGGYLDFYLEEGRRSYRLVSQLDLALYRTSFLLFQELSERFEFYSGALDFLRKAYFAPARGEDPFADFLRQMEGWVRIGISNN